MIVSVKIFESMSLRRMINLKF